VSKPGTQINELIAHNDWLPTFLAAAGEPDIKEKLKQGHKAGDKTFKVRLDGYNFVPFFKGEVQKGPRAEYFYFAQGGELNAVRVYDWKVHFAVQRGNIATGTRDVTGWPTIINLRADPYERGPNESGMYIRWYADNMWLFVPVQEKLKEFFADFDKYPYQAGSSLNAAGISYQTIRLAEAMKRLGELEEFTIAARN
jgi:arylsulfatase A-like enzyme